jgi:hypothetical protein
MSIFIVLQGAWRAVGKYTIYYGMMRIWINKAEDNICWESLAKSTERCLQALIPLIKKAAEHCNQLLDCFLHEFLI